MQSIFTFNCDVTCYCMNCIMNCNHREYWCNQYWITNTKQACMGSDAICVPYLLLLLPSGFDLITEPEVLIGVWSRAHPVCDRAALSVDREITTRGSGKVACKGIHPAIHRSLSLWVELTISWYWFSLCLGTDNLTSHYLNQWWLILLMHICHTQPP